MHLAHVSRARIDKKTLRLRTDFLIKPQGVQMKNTVVTVAAAILSACAHSGVVSVGPDTYMIANSEWGFTSGSYQKAQALKEASAYCKGLGKEMLPISTSQNDVSFGKTPAAEVQFRCLPPGDPELKRPAAQQTPER
jgi:hypothetical protein